MFAIYFSMSKIHFRLQIVIFKWIKIKSGCLNSSSNLIQSIQSQFMYINVSTRCSSNACTSSSLFVIIDMCLAFCCFHANRKRYIVLVVHFMLSRLHTLPIRVNVQKGILYILLHKHIILDACFGKNLISIYVSSHSRTTNGEGILIAWSIK